MLQGWRSVLRLSPCQMLKWQVVSWFTILGNSHDSSLSPMVGTCKGCVVGTVPFSCCLHGIRGGGGGEREQPPPKRAHKARGPTGHTDHEKPRKTSFFSAGTDHDSLENDPFPTNLGNLRLSSGSCSPSVPFIPSLHLPTPILPPPLKIA